jgi:hypothetical protein
MIFSKTEQRAKERRDAAREALRLHETGGRSLWPRAALGLAAALTLGMGAWVSMGVSIAMKSQAPAAVRYVALAADSIGGVGCAVAVIIMLVNARKTQAVKLASDERSCWPLGSVNWHQKWLELKKQNAAAEEALALARAARGSLAMKLARAALWLAWPKREEIEAQRLQRASESGAERPKENSRGAKRL